MPTEEDANLAYLTMIHAIISDSDDIIKTLAEMQEIEDFSGIDAKKFHETFFSIQHYMTLLRDQLKITLEHNEEIREYIRFISKKHDL